MMTYKGNTTSNTNDHTRFYQTVKQDTPRLVVKMRSTQGGEQFEWGIVGHIPPLSLVAVLRQLVNGLENTSPRMLEEQDKVCPEVAVVLVYIPESKDFNWFIHPECLCYPMIGMLEMILSMLTDAHKVRQVAAQSMIVGIDGKPIRG